MACLTSARERRLWTWILVVVATILATLGAARSLADVLRDRGLLDAAFALAAVLVLAAAAAMGWRARWGRAEVGVALGVTAVCLLVLVRMALPEERTHLVEYGVVAALVLEALRERRDHGRRVPFPALLAVALTTLAGTLDELVQGLLPGRVFDVRDIAFDAFAATLAVLASSALRRVRRRSTTAGPTYGPTYGPGTTKGPP